MDHFNATVKDGKLVNTRRGLQVSRQKFNGISFVNTSAQDSSSFSTQSFCLPKESPSKITLLPEIRFADKTSELQYYGRTTNIQEGQAKTPNLNFVSESGQQQQTKKQPRRRATPKGGQPSRASTSPYLSSPGSRPRSRSSVATPSPRFEETNLQFLASSSFPVSQQQQPQQRQPFPSPPVHHHYYRHQQHLQVSNLPSHPFPQLPPPWPPAELPTNTDFYVSSFFPSQSDWKLFHDYNTHHLPLQLYPYEKLLTYNPARSGSEESLIASSDIAAFHCVLMCGSVAEAVMHGQHHQASEPETDVKSFAYHISKICAILNKKLAGSGGEGVSAITLHCIAMLAWMGCYVGRLDHWHMHMRGLQKALDVLEGLGQTTNLPTWVVRRMHHADLKGATALASTPYLPFTRSSLPSLTTPILPQTLLAHTSHTLKSILEPLDIHRSVISTLTSLSNFSTAIRSARSARSVRQQLTTNTASVKFDPYSFTEELQSITYDLLTLPSPLLKKDHKYKQGGSPIPENTPRTEATPSDMAETLSSALRTASLLFLKELLPDYPRNLGVGCTAVLGFLRYHLQKITIIHSSSSRLDDDDTDHEGNSNNNNNNNDDDDGGGGGELLDPQLRYHHQPHQRTEWRQVLIFLCLVGDISTQRAKENDCHYRAADNSDIIEDGREYPRGVFRDCLLSVFGADTNNKNIIIGEQELEFVRLFNLEGLVGEEGWDEREGIRRLLSLLPC